MSSWGQNCRPPVILSEAKNLGSCGLHELRRSFLRCTQDRLRLLKVTSFPRKRESIGPTMGPRFRGDDADFRWLGWAAGPWKLLRMTTRMVSPQPCLPYITADPAGVQKRSKARVRSAAISSGMRLSMSWRSIM